MPSGGGPFSLAAADAAAACSAFSSFGSAVAYLSVLAPRVGGRRGLGFLVVAASAEQRRAGDDEREQARQCAGHGPLLYHKVRARSPALSPEAGVIPRQFRRHGNGRVGNSSM